MKNVKKAKREEKSQRKAYVTPQIETVHLLPKQTVLGSCASTSTGSMAFITSCVDPISHESCM